MFNLYSWAAKWGIPNDAVKELRDQMGIDPSQLPANSKITSESGVATQVRLKAARNGSLLWRNNVGATLDINNRMVRYGLANESKAINQRVKSSDFIGIIPVEITSDLIGLTIGQFVAIETKKPGWKYTGTDREVAQRKFLELVISKGGRGYFTNGVDETVNS